MSNDDDGPRPSQETLNRNWDELLQEIRVTQTGVQILTGFLLTVPFSNRFAELTTFQRNVYLAVHAGHGLTYENVGPVAAIPEIEELNIGHSVVSRAIFTGMGAAVADMRRSVAAARA